MLFDCACQWIKIYSFEIGFCVHIYVKQSLYKNEKLRRLYPVYMYVCFGGKLDAWSPSDVHCMHNYIYHMRSLFHNPHKLSFIVQIRRISEIEPDIRPAIKEKKNIFICIERKLEMELFLRWEWVNSVSVEFWASRTILNTNTIANTVYWWIWQ